MYFYSDDERARAESTWRPRKTPSAVELLHDRAQAVHATRGAAECLERAIGRRLGSEHTTAAPHRIVQMPLGPGPSARRLRELAGNARLIACTVVQRFGVERHTLAERPALDEFDQRVVRDREVESRDLVRAIAQREQRSAQHLRRERGPPIVRLSQLMLQRTRQDQQRARQDAAEERAVRHLDAR